MSAMINPSIVRSVYEIVRTEGQPSSSGYFLRGVYASGTEEERELSDRFSRVKIANDEVVESQFADATQRVRFMRKLRRIQQTH